jgi:hypothetical protein
MSFRSIYSHGFARVAACVTVSHVANRPLTLLRSSKQPAHVTSGPSPSRYFPNYVYPDTRSKIF